MDLAVVVAPLISLGLLGIGAVALAEKLLPVVPSHVVLIVLGMTAISDGGELIATVVATSIGSTIGSFCWYGLGRTLGPWRCEALVMRFGQYIYLSPPLYRRMTSAYQRNHFWATLVGQTVPAVRVYLAVPAGVLGVAPAGFLAATWLGSLAWSTPLLTLGFVLRGSGADPTSSGLMAVAGLIALQLTLLLVLRFGRSSRDGH